MADPILLKRQELILDLLLKSYRVIYADVGGLDALDILLLLAVRLGSVQGKPLNPSKLALYLDLPRSSVIRRLKVLGGQGLVVYGDRSPITSARLPDSPELLRLTEMLEGWIHQASAALSKLDTCA